MATLDVCGRMALSKDGHSYPSSCMGRERTGGFEQRIGESGPSKWIQWERNPWRQVMAGAPCLPLIELSPLPHIGS